MTPVLRLVLLATLLAGAADPLPAQGPSDTLLTLQVNLPAYRLEARRGTALLLTVHVAIGQRAYPTPRGRFQLTGITWNPWWYPPPSPWAAGDTVTPPCPANPVGRVKLGFGNAYFIHGTPQQRSIGSAASHGCVRARQEDALALAALVVATTMPESTLAAERYAGGTETRTMRLRTPVPLVIEYRLAEVRRDTLWMYPDVYRRTPATTARIGLARRALAETGARPPAESVLRALVARSRRGAAFLALPSPQDLLTANSGSVH